MNQSILPHLANLCLGEKVFPSLLFIPTVAS